ncbi:unknown [Proteobacteria bacterium CAG:139]|nr:unknown [Proteobacteria bacterium CAG:139]
MTALLGIHTHAHSGIIHDAVFQLLDRAGGIHTAFAAECVSADNRHFLENDNFLALLRSHDGSRKAGAAGTDDNKVSFFGVNDSEGQCRNECDTDLFHLCSP